MVLKFQHSPRPWRILAAIVALAAGSWLMAADTNEAAEQKAPTPPPATTEAPTPVPANPLGSAAEISGTPSATGNVTANSTAAMPAGSNLGQLLQFVNQPPERIKELRKILVWLDDMSPAQREALRVHLETQIQNIRQVRQAIAPDIAQLTAPQRDVLIQYTMTLYPEDSQKLLQSLQAAGTPEQRKKIIDDMLAAATARGIKPRPPPVQQPGGRGNPTPGGRGNGPLGGRDGGRGFGGRNFWGPRPTVPPPENPPPAPTSTATPAEPPAAPPAQ